MKTYFDEVLISEYFCPNDQCKEYGLRNQGNLVKAGSYLKGGEKKQMLKCKICGQRFSETRNTIFAHCHYSEKEIGQIITCAIEGNGVRAISRITGKSKNGVNKVILKAGESAELILTNLLSSLHLQECQLDELWSFVHKKGSIRRGHRKGVWLEMDLDGIFTRKQVDIVPSCWRQDIGKLSGIFQEITSTH